MTLFARVVVTVALFIASFSVGGGVSLAALDNELSMVDGQGRTLTIQQWDTFLNGVFPLDRNRLSRERFHSGKASYIVSGEDAQDFVGTIELGYQVGFPWRLDVGVNFSYTTPNIAYDGYDLPFGNDQIPDFPYGFTDDIVTTPLLPGASISAELGSATGVQEVATFEVDVEGPSGSVTVSNAQGTVTGVAGGVLLRPFARLKTEAGDMVTTYGSPWNMN